LCSIPSGYALEFFSIKFFQKNFFKVLLTFVNCANVRWSTRTQDWSTITKIVALALIVVAGLVNVILGKNWVLIDFMSPIKKLLDFLGVAK